MFSVQCKEESIACNVINVQAFGVSSGGWKVTALEVGVRIETGAKVSGLVDGEGGHG